MRLWDKIRAYLQIGANRKKVVIAGVAIFAVVGLVFFGPSLQNLFNRFPSKAGVAEDLAKTWLNLSPGTVSRAHAKAIAITQGDKRWLYVIGGLETYSSGGVTHNRLLRTVQRIEISPNDGSPVTGVAWENLSSMQVGHAEFGVLTTTVNNKEYLYVVGGDIHVPTITTTGPLDKVPLLYATIERLDLSDNNASWDTVALLTGVNFYPEVAMFDSRLHVVGGVYGNPFGPLDNCGPSAYSSGVNANGTADPIALGADLARWNVIRDLPVIGPGLELSVAQTGATVVTTNQIVTQPETGTTPEIITKPQTFWLSPFKIGTARAADAPMTITAPPAGIVLKPDITYSVVIDNVPTYGHTNTRIVIEYRDKDSQNSNWQIIHNASLVGWLGPKQYVYDWKVPNIKSNHVQIRVRIVYTDPGGNTKDEVDPAFSGIFSIGTSFANMLSESLLAGDFVTTVSEHYVINPANFADNRASELGSDFSGSFSNIWAPGAIMHIGHLRFTEIATETEILEDGRIFGTYKIVPVPQGRYGHKLLIDNNKLVVVGGASWMPEQQYRLARYTTDFQPPSTYEVFLVGRYFWVVDSAPFPTVHIQGGPPSFPPLGWTGPIGNGGYVGHIAYTLSNSSSSWQVAGSYDLKNATGISKGRAFFGLATSAQKQLAVAGLENTTSGDITVSLSQDPTRPDNPYVGNYFIGVAPTGRTESLSGQSWTTEPDYLNGEAVYNLTAAGLDTRTIAFGGQTQFACSTSTGPWDWAWDPHVPNPSLPRSNTTALFQQSTGPSTGSAWYPMESIGINGHGTADLIFSADTLVATALGGGQSVTSPIHNWYIYRYGGFTKTLAISNIYQGLGVFTSAQAGVPYPPNSTLSIVPATVTADGHTAAIATVTLKDYFQTPVKDKHTVVYGAIPPNHLPPKDTDEVKVTPFQGGSPDSNFDAHYLKTDAQGVASFKLTSLKVATQQIWAVWTDVPNASQGVIGPESVTFTDENMPDQLLSTVAVDRTQVVADNSDYATITVTLKGKKNGAPNSPLPGLYVKVFSDRNLKDAVIDNFTTINGQTDLNGRATFRVQSGTKGLATISAAYNYTPDLLRDDPIYLSQTRAVRFVDKDEFAITLAADPTSLPLEGGNNTSVLTATVSSVIPDGTTVTFVLDGSGSIQPIQVATSQGKAIAHYYRASGLKDPTTVTITAKVTPQGAGTIISNPVVITIGLNPVDYLLAFVSDKTEVPAGGNEHAKLTATLTYKGTPQRNWPMTFSITEGRLGDYLTVVSGTTNTSGVLETEFVPGIYPGNVIITAQPAGLPAKQVALTKTLDQTIDAHLSSISAVPSFVPANGVATATITVTLRNSRYSPLPGKSVTISSDRNSGGTVDTITPNGAQLTNENGKVYFTIKSSTVGKSNIRATAEGVVLGPAAVNFEPAGSLISATLDVKVPLEAKAYDREIKTYLRELTTGMAPTINEVYLTDANDKLIGLPTTYLHPGKSYSLWVKGHYHLARTLQFTAPAASGQTVTLNFTSLLIGDLIGSTESDVFPGFNDNKINTVDLPPLFLSWFKNSYLADFDSNGIVNTLDIAYWFRNYGIGAPLP